MAAGGSSRTELDGTVTTLVDRLERQAAQLAQRRGGQVRRHDLVHRPALRHPDRPRGLAGRAGIWRLPRLLLRSRRRGELRVAADDFVKPNGIAFSPDEKILYIADTGASHDPDGPRHIRAFDVSDKGKLKKSRVFATCDAGLFDGFRLDTAGRVWSSAGDGVHCYAPDGTLLGKILVPEVVSNVCFGGVKKNRLYICGTTSLYAVLTHVNGAQTP